MMASRSDLDPVTRVRIASWMRWYKESRGWTHEQLAKQLGVSIPTVTNILNDKRTPGLDIVIRMHRRLHRSADDLLDVDPPPIRKPAP